MSVNLPPPATIFVLILQGVISVHADLVMIILGSHTAQVKYNTSSFSPVMNFHII